jgi:hypothetical protein
VDEFGELVEADPAFQSGHALSDCQTDRGKAAARDGIEDLSEGVGLGNTSLPSAKGARSVIGEGVIER